MSTSDSHVIDILPGSDPNKENIDNKQNEKERNYRISTELIKRPRHDGLSDEKIICRYREYAEKSLRKIRQNGQIKDIKQPVKT